MVSTLRTLISRRQTSHLANAAMFGEKSTTVFGGLMILAAIHSFRTIICRNGYLTTTVVIWRLAVATADLLNVAEVQSIGLICHATDKETAQSTICLLTAVGRLV